MADLIARPDGEFTVLTSEGRVFDLTNTSPSSRRWVAVETPFVPVRLVMRQDGHVCALDDMLNVWQRLPDRRGPDAWKQVARAPA